MKADDEHLEETAPEYIERSPETQRVVETVAQVIFGRKPEEGRCVMCGSTKMSPGDFRNEISLRESRISYQCQPCQDETFA